MRTNKKMLPLCGLNLGKTFLYIDSHRKIGKIHFLNVDLVFDESVHQANTHHYRGQRVQKYIVVSMYFGQRCRNTFCYSIILYYS